MSVCALGFGECGAEWKTLVEETRVDTALKRLQVERATHADLPALVELRREQGWHPNELLLRALLAWERARLFVVRSAPDGPPIASTSAIAPGAIGVIGNVVTAPAYRRRGLGRLLMQTTLDWLREQRVRHAVLDATADGRPLYTRLGFVPVAPSYLVASDVSTLDTHALLAQTAGRQARISGADGLARLRALDEAAFGGDRMWLLERLLALPYSWLYTVEEAGEPLGYLALRYPHERTGELRLGPWVARDSASAAALLASALGEEAPWRAATAADGLTGQERILMPFSAVGGSALSLLTEIGAAPQIDDLVMQLDLATDDSAAIPLAIHPEWVYGWLSNMVF